MKVSEVATILGLSRRRVNVFISEGRLPAVRHANGWEVDAKDLELVRVRTGGRPAEEKRIVEVEEGTPAQVIPFSRSYVCGCGRGFFFSPMGAKVFVRCPWCKVEHERMKLVTR